MIAVDTNLLVYAHRTDAAFHQPARAALEALALGRAAWAIPCYLMLGCTDRATLLRWAWLAAGLYALWWVFWWHQIWNGTWQWYVLVGYLPLRAFQLGAHLYFGLRPPAATPA